MPLLQPIKIDENTTIFSWHITEPLEAFVSEVFLTERSKIRYNSIKAKNIKKSFLATRKLLENIGYSDEMLQYDPNGKPFLSNGKEISISHSFDRVVVIISDKKVGIDIEKKREKIRAIATKFTSWDYKKSSYSPENSLQKLTMIWAAKEAAFKIHGNPAITISQIAVKDFFPTDKKTTLKIEKSFYDVYFITELNFVISFCIKFKNNE